MDVGRDASATLSGVISVGMGTLRAGESGDGASGGDGATGCE